MPISVVQTVGPFSLASGASFPANVTAGNTIFIACGGLASNGGGVNIGIPALGGSADNWAVAVSFPRTNSSTQVKSSLLYDPDCAGSAKALTFPGLSVGGISSFANGYAWEVTGLGTSPIIDVTDSTSGGTGTAAWSTGGGQVTVGGADFVLFAVADGGTPAAASSPWSNVNSGGFRGGYQITTSSGVTVQAGGGSSPTSSIWAGCLAAITAGSGGPSTITDTDTVSGLDAVVAQTMKATDAFNATTDAPVGIRLFSGDTGSGGDSPSLTAHPTDSDSSNGAAIDLPGNQILSATDSGTSLETPSVGPKDADTGHGNDAAGTITATIADNDAASQAVEVANTPASVITDSDAANAAVESNTVTTSLKSDTDSFHGDDEPGAISAVLTAGDAGAGNEIAARNPVTDTDSFTGADTVVAYGVILGDSDTFHGTDSGGFGTVFTGTDSSQATIEAFTLIVKASDTIQGTDTETTTPSAVLSAADTAHSVEVGFVDFDGFERASTSLSASWRVLQRKHQSAAANWKVLERQGKAATTRWKTIQRRSQATAFSWSLLRRVEAGNAPVLLKWRVFNIITKTASTQWRVLDRNKTLGHTAWNVSYRHLSNTVTTEWNVFSMFPVRKLKATALGWNTHGRVVKAAILKWNVQGIPTPVTRLIKTSWKISKRLSESTSTKWRVKIRTDQTTSTLWNVRQRKHQSASSTWNVGGGTTRTSQICHLGWTDLFRKSTSRTVEWDAWTRLNTSEQLGWVILQGKHTPAKTLEWKTYQRLFLYPDSALELENNQPITLENNHALDTEAAEYGPSLDWNIKARTSASCHLGWDAIGRVQSSPRLVRWDVSKRTVGRHATMKWNVRSRTHQSKTCTWNVYDPVSQSASVKWETLKRRQHAPVLLEWRVRKRPHIINGIHWKTRERLFLAPGGELDEENGLEIDQENNIELLDESAAGGPTLAWRVRNRSHESATLGWNVQPHGRATVQLGWNVETRRHATFKVRWLTLDSGAVTATIEWNVYQGAQGLIHTAPAAPWQSAYPSR